MNWGEGILNWKFWEKDISEPVYTLAKELEQFDNWKYDYVSQMHNLGYHQLSHVSKEIILGFRRDWFTEGFVCIEDYLTQDEMFVLGNIFWKYFEDKKRKKLEVRKQEQLKERQRVAKELGV